MPFSKENRHFTLSIMAIIVSLFAVAIGVQAFLVQQAREDATAARVAFDNEQIEQAVRDRAYAKCLTNFAADLVNSLQAGREATAKLNEARDAKDKELDRLISIIAAAQSSGATTQEDVPPALLRRYNHVLAERVAAQKKYNRAARDYEKFRRDNPLVSPKVVCTR